MNGISHSDTSKIIDDKALESGVYTGSYRPNIQPTETDLDEDINQNGGYPYSYNGSYMNSLRRGDALTPQMQGKFLIL